MSKYLKLNQKGMTLVEIILVFAIVGIMAGSAFLIIGHLRYADTEKAARAIDSALDKLQVETMSKSGSRYLYIYHLGNGCYMKVLSEDLTTFDSSKLDNSGKRLANNTVEIYMDSEDSAHKVDGTTFIKVTYTKALTFDSTNTNVSNIIVKGGPTYKIQLVTDTGKHFLNH